MSSESELTWEEVYEAVNNAVYQKFGEYMKDSEVEVLQGCWEGKTYPKIAVRGNYSSSYIGRNIGPDLWKKLTEALGEKVSKTNFREALKRASLKSKQQIATTEIEFPEGVVSLESEFYVERSPIESNCYQEILQPGALLRIKAPQKMGKTSLLKRIIAEARSKNYRTVNLNLRQPNAAIFSDLDKFLRWFCASVSKKLDIAAKLNDNWDEDLGSNVNCTTYFELHLLEEIESPLVLALDEVDRVFDYQEIYPDFFGLLRSWYEEAKNLEIWEKLRLVVAYSTEYELNINQSPFNVGFPVELKDFTVEQVKYLARVHKSDLDSDGVNQLMAMVGGNPYLIRLAFYHLAADNLTLEKLLEDAPTDAGIYRDRLQSYLESLQQNLELAKAFQDVINTTEGALIETFTKRKLYRMGLIEERGDRVFPRCELYRQYFSDRLSSLLAEI